MENRLFFKDKELKEHTSRVIGISGENEQETLVFLFEDDFVDGTGYLEIEFPSGCCNRKCSIEVEKDVENESYKLEVKNSLLRFEGILRMQLKIVNETAVWKSTIFDMHVLEAINTTENIEEDYPDLVRWIKTRMQEIEKGFEQLDKKVDGIEVPTKLSDLKNDLEFEGFSGDYNDLKNKPEIPDTSGFITNTVDDLVNYYSKTESYSKEEINSIINNISTLNILVVESLPTESISTFTIYLVAKENSEDSNVYDEYIYVSGSWEKIGDTKVDLTGLATEEYVNSKIGRLQINQMTEDTATILPNLYYIWGEMAELNIALGELTNDGYTNEYCFEFKSGEVATTLTMDEGIKWVTEPNIEANKTYQVSILNGIGVMVGA